MPYPAWTVVPQNCLELNTLTKGDWVCRTPQGIRAASRFYVLLFIPLFFGPYYAWLSDNTHSFAFALFFALLVRPSTNPRTDVQYHAPVMVQLSGLVLVTDPSGNGKPADGGLHAGGPL